jgi:SAM-dependent methyltransferase
MGHPETATIRDVRLDQAQATDWARAAGGDWASPERLWAHLIEHTNIVDAARAVDWDALLPHDARVLDLGCGSGWLTGLLSAHGSVARVTAWDASQHLLEEILPAMVTQVGGTLEKVDRVCGGFAPLLLDDDSIDAVVMSSAFHHADAPGALLDEIRRVLAPGGVALLLNETPWHQLAMTSFVVRTTVGALAGVRGTRAAKAPSGAIATDHVLYDPVLGDRARSLAQWQALIARHGFALEVQDTGLPSYKAGYRSRGRLEGNLVNLVLRPL